MSRPNTPFSSGGNDVEPPRVDHFAFKGTLMLPVTEPDTFLIPATKTNEKGEDKFQVREGHPVPNPQSLPPFFQTSSRRSFRTQSPTTETIGKGKETFEVRGGQPVPNAQTLPPTVQRLFSKRLVTENPGENTYTAEYISSHPFCSLNLVCYRSGTHGCKLHQIRVAAPDRFKSSRDFENAVRLDPQLVLDDVRFFKALRNGYLNNMCGFWRRAFFLKSLRGIRLLSYTPTSRPTIVPLDDFVLQEIMFAYQNPSKIQPATHWIDWVFRLRQEDHRHALEFVEGWNGTRIAVAGSFPLILSTLVGIVWSVKGSGVQDAFAVAGFILTAGSLLLALLAVISGIESSRQSSAKNNND